MSSHWNPIPPVRVGAPIQLHTLDDKLFERVCSELFEQEPSIVGCDIYGTPGQGQHGVDLIARESDNVHIQVGQCKCYKQFSTSNIRKVSKEFFDHWDEVWASRGVTRFILFLACEIEETTKQDEVDRQRAIFEKSSIKYEVWPASRVIKKLRPHRGIVSSYFKPPEHWVKEICGEPFEFPRSTTSSILYESGEQLSAVLSGAVETAILNIREAWQEGRRADARRILTETRENASEFGSLPSSLRAKLVRFEAIDILESGGDVTQAEKIAQEAASIDSSGGGALQLQATIEVHKDNLLGALQILESTTDSESIHFRASILVALGRMADADAALAALQDQKPTAETHRLRSLISLFEGDLSSALLSSQKAVEAQPLWPRIIFLNAALEFLSGLALPPRVLPARPEPVSWDLVRRDDESVRRFAHAAALFDQLLRGSDISVAEREGLEAWKLGCLANQTDAQDQASALCSELLDREPGRLEAVAWTIARGYDVNLNRSASFLKDRVNNGTAQPDQIISLVLIYCRRKQWLKADRVLEQRRGQFAEGSQATLWRVWKAQVLALQNHIDEATSLLGDSPHEDEVLSLLRTNLVASQVNAPENGRKALEQYYLLYETTREARYLLYAWTLAEALQDWTFISERSTEMLRSLGTAELAGRLARSLFTAGRYEKCLSVVDGSIRLFPGERLPIELRRLRINCQQRLGAIPAAVEEAERLARDEPNLPHLLGLSEIYFAKGDFRRLSLLARDLLKRPDLQSDDALRLSWQTQWEDAVLARDLWHRAIALGVEDSAVMTAIRIAYALGLEDQLEHLTRRMEELGRQGRAGIRIASLDELIEHTREFQKRSTELSSLYVSAQIPVHFLSSQVNLCLADLYHGQIERCLSCEDLSTGGVILARYGGRATASGVESVGRTWLLHIDITSLLLAADLNLLPALEKTYRPIRLSRHAVPSLVAMRDYLTIHQPGRLSAAEEVTSLIDKGALVVLDPNSVNTRASFELPPGMPQQSVELLNTAHENDGYVVEFLPIPTESGSIDSSLFPVEVRSRIINCRTVIEALRLHGPFSDREWSSTLARLGAAANDPIMTVPSPNDLIYFDGTTVELLASSGALGFACQRFRCQITLEESERLNAELRGAEAQQSLGGWVAALIDRVSRGIDDQAYEIITGNEPDPKREHARDLDVACLISLLGIKADGNCVVWIDDRWANRHLQAGSVPIVDVLDVLRALRSAGAISEDEFFEKLLRLRSGNVLFLPFDSPEILWHLGRASVGEQGVVETIGLAALRRGVASSLLHSDILRKPNDQQVAESVFEEGSFTLSFHHAMTEALLEIWRSQESLQDRRARADWLIKSLYVDPHLTKRFAGLTSDSADVVALAANRFAILLSKAFHLPMAGPESSRSSEYIHWLSERVLEEAIKNEPGLAARTAEVIKNPILSLVPRRLRTKREKTVLYFLNKYILLLPVQIQNELLRDTDFATRLKLRSIIGVDISGLRFERGEFLAAAQAAINGSEGFVQDATGKSQYTLRRGASPLSYALQIVGHDAQNPSTINVIDPMFGLLSDSPTEREAAMHGQHHLFDMAKLEFSAFVAEVASGEDPGWRFQRAEDARSNGAVYYYEQLRALVKRNAGFDRRQLVPNDPMLLARHYRLEMLSDGGQASAAFAKGTAALLGEETLSEVILRLVRLPIPLPDVVLNKVRLLSLSDQRNLFDELLAASHSPLSCWHIVFLLRVSNDPEYLEHADQMAELALSPDALEEFEAYKSVLIWCMQEFRVWAYSGGVSDGLCLSFAWSHAHQIFTFFNGAGASPDWIRGVFRSLGNRVPFGPVEVESRLRTDVNHPVNLTREAFLLGCLYYSFRPSEQEPIPKKLADAFYNIAVTDTDAGPIPALSLLLDPEAVFDQVASILGANRHSMLMSLLPLERKEALRRIVSESTVTKTVAELEENSGSIDRWIRLHAVLGGSIIPDSHLPKLGAIILKSDFASFVASNPEKGLMPILLASMHVRHLNNSDIREHLLATLLASARLLRKSGGCTRAEGSVQLVIETALNISLCSPRASSVLDEFGRIIQSICNEWPAATEFARLVIQSLCEDLPLGEGDALWKLNLKLRSCA